MSEETETKTEIKMESEVMKKYFDDIYDSVKKEYVIAGNARKKGFDPEDKVDSPLAANMIERVEGLISAVAPQLIGSGASERMFELEKEFGVLDWRVSLVIAEEIAKQKFCKFDTELEAIEVGIRTGFAYHTLGIVSAPLEGFTNIEIKNTRNGKKYFSINFAGPIRGAGGTGASVCVLIADYVRKKMGYDRYDPDQNEAKRYDTELNDYHDRVTNLQYHPSSDEIIFLASNLPIEVAGDPSEKIEVSNQKDLPRVKTNKIRGGMCLVFSMIALKAPKLWKRLEQWGQDFDLDWMWMEDFIKLQKKKKAGGAKKSDDGEKPKIAPNKTFIADLVAGRPVLTYPMAYGGLRLRYGRGRTTGFSSAAIHPSTMFLLDDFFAIGTQMKVERPGKAATLNVCDELEGPVVKLKNGKVLRVGNIELAKQVSKEVDRILFLGDVLFNYGDFSENGHVLVPPGYCEEWWMRELEKNIIDKEGDFNLELLKKNVDVDESVLNKILENCKKNKPNFKDALEISTKLNLSLHPDHLFFYKGVSKEDLLVFLDFLERSEIEKENDFVKKIIMPASPDVSHFLEKIGIPHTVASNEFAVIDNDYASSLYYTLGLKNTSIEDTITKVTSMPETNILDVLNKLAPFNVRDKCGTFIGARMGRPEKAKMRTMKGNPHSLFPVGPEGGRMKSFQSALDANKVTTQFALYYCDECKQETILSVCEDCGNKTKKKYYCRMCGLLDEKSCQHEKNNPRYKKKQIPFNELFNKSLNKLKTSVYPDLIKGLENTPNKDHIVEHPIKGILRAKHELLVNKDGSVRYDMSELPITHFKPKEIQTSVEKLKKLGYEKDYLGNDLVDNEQIVELKPQDVILPALNNGFDESCEDILFRCGQFIDELLEKLYGLEPYYNFRTKEDVAGTLVLGLAPHISAAMIGRVIGFSKTAGCYAHPMWHAALRRDCDGDEASVSLLLDSLLNFSRKFLPDRIGSRTMDAPLVVTAKLIPSEVDDMVHGMDVVDKYPLEFYEAAMEYKPPWDVKIEQFGKRLNTPAQYEGLKFTHDTTNINLGVQCSAYKTLPSMGEKIAGQMHIAEMVDAVETSGVAELVINKHLLKDLKGNLRKFSMQQFRCTRCNEKYRRVPLSGKCNCGNKLIFTISQGSVTKYLEPSLTLGTKYEISTYLKQVLDMLKERIDSVFGKEKEKQEGLDKWF